MIQTDLRLARSVASVVQSGDRRRSPTQAKIKGEIAGREKYFIARLSDYLLTG
jgi:hypothetical protein